MDFILLCVPSCVMKINGKLALNPLLTNHLQMMDTSTVSSHNLRICVDSSTSVNLVLLFSPSPCLET